MTHPGKFRSLLATARIANIPSVISNVWVGLAIACIGAEIPAHFFLTSFIVSVAGVMLYVSGNFLNDWQDREWDATHRPERALPRQLFTARQYLITAAIAGISGVLLAGTTRLPSAAAAVGILMAIIVYTKWHKQTPWAVIPMGICRALLPLMGFFAIRSGAGESTGLAMTISQSTGLLCYIAGLSLSARYESMAEPPALAHRLSRGLLLTSGLIIAITWSVTSGISPWIGLVPFGIWIFLCLTIFRRPIPAHVSALLAGIPFLDWIGLLPLSLTWLKTADSMPMGLLALAIAPLAVVAGRTLQQVAAAT